MPKKDYVKRDITLVGRTQDTEEDKACDICVEGDKFLSSAVKHDNRINYNKIEVDTPEGEKVYDHERFQGIPFIKDCKTYEKDGTPRCRKIEGFEKDDWDDLSDLVESKTITKEEPAVEPVETPKEPEVSEPNEPSQS